MQPSSPGLPTEGARPARPKQMGRIMLLVLLVAIVLATVALLIPKKPADQQTTPTRQTSRAQAPYSNPTSH